VQSQLCIQDVTVFVLGSQEASYTRAVTILQVKSCHSAKHCVW